MVRIAGFHPAEPGSLPGGVTNLRPGDGTADMPVLETGVRNGRAGANPVLATKKGVKNMILKTPTADWQIDTAQASEIKLPIDIGRFGSGMVEMKTTPTPDGCFIESTLEIEGLPKVSVNNTFDKDDVITVGKLFRGLPRSFVTEHRDANPDLYVG